MTTLEKKREALARLLEKRAARPAHHPLSFAQERIWFVEQLQPGAAYNIAAGTQVPGFLPVSVLAASLGEIVRRHEILRAEVAVVDGKPVQVIAEASAPPLAIIDLSGLPEGARKLAEAQGDHEIAHAPLDVSRGPLYRFALVRFGPAGSKLSVVLHHFVADGWSLDIFFRELTALVEAFAAGRPSPLPDLPLQYVDFVRWQRRRLRGETLEAELAWWSRQLQGGTAPLDLPADHPRPPVQSFRGASEPVCLPPALAARLAGLGQRKGATMFMVLLAGLQTLLHRVTRDEGVSVGSPIAGRPRRELEGLIGLFANLIVLRTDLGGDPSFLELIGRVREVAIGAYAHQDVPFEKLVEALQPDRDASRTPLFQVSLVLQGLQMGSAQAERDTAKFDLTFEIAEGPDGVRGTLEYCRALFERATARRLARYFETLLAGAADSPEARLSELPLLSAAERRQVVVEWNETRSLYPRESTIQALFEAQVEATPEAPAIVGEEESWSYRELNRRANRLAHHLRALGVGPEVPVGLCLDRSPELIAAVLGILKAGGAYVPLDPSYPQERLRFLLTDSGLRLLVSREPLAAELPLGETPVVDLDRDAGALSTQSEDNPPPAGSATHLAYVIYTSGSTGVPKGVAVPHRAVVRLVRETNYVRLGPAEVFLQLAPVSFDASTLEIWGALLNGARLAIFPGRVPSLDELGAALAHHGVTTLWLTAGLFHQMVDERLGSLSGVRQLLAGGDVLSPAHVRRVLEELPGCTLINGYGPTENTTFTCCRPLTGPGEVGASVPIGRPIANTRVYLLDRSLHPVPVGVPGELCAGGDGLARGYLGRPALTAERFVPDPFGNETGEPGGRLYRTGDLARRRPGGDIEFLGRTDHQVKVRGFRIELGEIEAALRLHREVREAVVLLRRDLPGGGGLVACVTPAGAGSSAELHGHLAERLPDYMVPAAFLFLESMPLTENGKIDRRSLAALPLASLERGTTGDSGEPRTPTEELLAGLWAEVLGLGRVGLHDSFFDLGGHSLLATRLIARLRDIFGVELPLRALFEQPTVAGLAVAVEEARRGGSGLAAAPPLVPVPREDGLQLSFAQERLWFLHRLAPESWTYNIPAALRIEGRLSQPALEASLTALVARHEALRTAYPEIEGRPVQQIFPPAPVILPVVDLSALPGARQQEAAQILGTEEARRPFDLDRGPVLRFILLALGLEEHIAIWTLHHIVGDGWSLAVLVREMGTFYMSFASGRSPQLPALPVQYADFAAWQRGWLAGEVLEAEVAWWREHLAGVPELLELPLDRPRPSIQSFRGAHLRVAFPPGLTLRLASFASRHGATHFIVILAALQAWLSRITRQRDLVVGSPVAGRSPGTEGLIGFFLNTLALRGDLSGDPAFTDLVARARTVFLEAHAHQDLPFEKLVAELSPQRSLAHAPLFQVMLAFLHVGSEQLNEGSEQAPGAAWVPLGVEQGGSKFDLSLALTEGEAGISGSWEYTSDLFDATTVERMAGHFERLLSGAFDHPETRVSELPLLSPAERHQLCLEWNDTGRRGLSGDGFRGGCVHELFERQARQTPDAIAVICGDEELTYAGLAARSARIAHHLRSLGVGPDVLVGLLVERSLDMITGVLAILQAGGAYVPLDPRYPAERLAFMLADTSSPVVLTQEPLRGRLPEGDTRVVCLDAEDDGASAFESFTSLTSFSPDSPDSLAYVIYTSGSTGRPKGVALPHRALRNLIDWHLATLLGGVPTLQFASLSFDASFHEMFACWGSGGTLVVVPEELRRDMPALAGLLVERQIEKAILPVVVLQQLADLFAERRELPQLREITTTGERLQTNRAMAALLRRLPGCAFHNHYGPSETHVATTFTLPSDPEDWAVHPSIGRPLWSCTTWVVEPGLEPAPAGVPGDLYIGGACLARGYLGRPGLTAERFVPDPFSGEPGARLYRTGDKVRLSVHGDLEYLGRFDDQVKIRGFRIEPGEIEAALAAHPAVREAAVVVRESALGERSLAAYAALESGAEASVATLRSFLRERLPEHMVPAAFMILDKLPLTPNGKVSRKDLPAPDRVSPGAALTSPRTELERDLARIWCEVLDVEQVGTEDNFFDVGGHSMRLIEVQSRLRRTLGREVSVVDLFRHPTIAALARFLEPAEPANHAQPDARPALPALAAWTLPGSVSTFAGASSAIAVIGMAGRFPKAGSVDELWANLRDGREAVETFTDDEMRAAGASPEMLADPRYVKNGTALDGIELFDAELFGFSPREAEMMDPQQRFFLETAWQALEDAGYNPRGVPGRVGVWAGAELSSYLFHLLSRPDLLQAVGMWSALQGIDKDYLANRVSYELNLKGPSLSVQTSCSTSLVAVHLACRSLAGGECDMALAGGVGVHTPQRTGYLYEEGMVNSPDGHCRAFDASARGIVSSSGVGIVVLKRLDDALRDGDTIRAVIRGTAINNDGSLKVGYTAPSVDGQAEVISTALAAAGVASDSISYVEAHGTGTPLGDPIEVAALTRAFRSSGADAERRGFCGLGSLKTNIGHLGAAAGVAGLIKTALALEHRQIPPSLHFEKPNPAIDFAASPFYVVDRLTDWETGGAPRRAGVSSFGIGGTNAHAVLEEAPPPEPSGPSRPRQLLLLSARTAAALEEATTSLAAFLDHHPEAPLADVAHTLRVGRHPFDHRRMLVCASREDALKALESRDPERLLTRRRETRPPAVAWLLPGQGSQHPGMGRDLYAAETVFRGEVDRCAEILAPRLGRDLKELLFAADAGSAAELTRTRLAQPALFVVEHALARLWLSWGIRPQALIGHSLGEYVAACLAGVLSLDDALALVAARGELMQELPSGAMLSVDLTEAEVLAEIAGSSESSGSSGLALAAVNAPGQCVVSGPEDEIAALAARLAERGVPARRLHTSHAFHSPMMDPILDRFTGLVSRLELRPPSLPYLSNLTGTWITAAEATDPRYWTRHLRETVRFGDGIGHLLAGLPQGAVLLEVGPGQALGRLVRRQAPGHPVVPSMPHPGNGAEDHVEPATLLQAVGRLWLAGVEVDWSRFEAGERRRRVRLPTYPFQRRRYWVETHPAPSALPQTAASDVEAGWISRLESAGWRLLAIPPGEDPGLNGGALDLTRPEGREALRTELQRLTDLPTVETPPGASPGDPPDAEAPVQATYAGHARPDLETPYVEARTDTERRLAGIWSSLLGIAQVGVHDDFFELGGHSLLATRLLSRVRETFGRELTLESVFAAPTVARLAVHIDEEPAGDTGPPLVPVPRTGDLPLSFAQQRLLFMDFLAVDDVTYNLPLGLRLEGALDPEALRQALARLVDRHEVLRTSFRITAGEASQVIAPAFEPPLPVLDLSVLSAAGQEAESLRIALAEARQPFDLLQGPILRALLLRWGPGSHVLLLTLHHIAGDGWSWGVLFQDLVELYEALAEGRPARLPELPIQYADFAAWQRSRIDGEVLDNQMAYWRRQLASLPVLELPADHPRPAVRTGRGDALPLEIPGEIVNALRRLCRDENATLFMALTAAFSALLRHDSGEDDLVVGTDVANRTRGETEGLIGLFVNQLVLRNDLSGDPTFRELLRRVRAVTLAAFAHQDTPFDKLVEVLNPVRDMSRTPLFQVKIVLQNTPMEARAPRRNLSVSPYSFFSKTAKFDLLLNLGEMGPAVVGQLEYSTDLYETETVERMLARFASLLQAVANQPDARLSDLKAVLVEDERQERERRAQERREARSRKIGATRRRTVAVEEPVST